MKILPISPFLFIYLMFCSFIDLFVFSDEISVNDIPIFSRLDGFSVSII